MHPFSRATRRRALLGAATAVLVAVPATAYATWDHTAKPVRGDADTTWIVDGTPVPATITGGPWTLGQSAATYADPTAGYCDASGAVTRNPGTNLLQPDYFPDIIGRGDKLQAFLDYRPK